MPYPEFDLSRLAFVDAGASAPAVTAKTLCPLNVAIPDSVSKLTEHLGKELVIARNQGGATIFLCDADVIRAGVSLHLIDLMEKGLLTHLCIEPASVLCDWEFAATGNISSNASQQLAKTKLIQSLLATLASGDAAQSGCGESLGRHILEEKLPFAEQSLLAQGFRWGVPVTVHAALGGAMLHAVDGFQPATVGKMLHRDFLLLANSAENLDDGVVYQFGQPVAAVEVFCTSLAISRNVAAQVQRPINDFTAARFSSSSEKSTIETSVLRTAEPDRRHDLTGAPEYTIPAIRAAALEP
jgi:hypothetical protein